MKDKSEKVLKVQSDFMIVTPADIVVRPSAPDAFVEGIMKVKNGYGTELSVKKL